MTKRLGVGNFRRLLGLGYKRVSNKLLNSLPSIPGQPDDVLNVAPTGKVLSASEANHSKVESSQKDPRFEFSEEKFHENYSRVAEIGEGRRWYDLPYRVLDGFFRSRFWKFVPQRLRELVTYFLSYLHAFNTHDRDKAWDLDDLLHNLNVPDSEHVYVPSLWVVELFPPSQFAALERAIKNGNWDRRRRLVRADESNRRHLELSRSGKGWTWWRLAEIAQSGSKAWFPDGTREVLPAHFDSIELKAVQIGAGLTAVIAKFRLTETAARQLDDAWHTKHEPQLVMGRGLPKAENRHWASLRLTQEARRAYHDAARSWMAERCPGFFSFQREPQPLLDLLLMSGFDPLQEDRAGREIADALRALGFTSDLMHRTSPSLPGILLSAVDGLLCRALEERRTWGLWGNTAKISAIPGYLEEHGGDSNRAIAHIVDRRIRNFSVILAISGFLEVTEAEYAKLRDTARTRHGAFKAKRLHYLRRSLLTLSLDLTSVARDIDDFWTRNWHDGGDAQFILDYSPRIVEEDQKEGRERFEPINMNDDFRERQQKWFEKLIKADRDYREILATVASLGASADTYRISRVALWAAIASLIVASVTLLATEANDRNILGVVLSWLKRIVEAW
ncbi:hypothetical protein O7631_01720 [Micromonospora sp. WMMD967]|uniref:hypothetical protein n=1 Tax=Micromonospora sp. WMMD967 TaxID=3016101 RepID=UPI002416B0D1|nr:hypothetical protein [Micromonospora sp. WMMD967]MDG4835233.1 hypothetical protein [Micromonospora sp. WMMD967]